MLTLPIPAFPSHDIEIHKASAPVESPATDLGFLVLSIQVQPDFDNLRIRVVSLHSIAAIVTGKQIGRAHV